MIHIKSIKTTDKWLAYGITNQRGKPHDQCRMLCPGKTQRGENYCKNKIPASSLPHSTPLSNIKTRSWLISEIILTCCLDLSSNIDPCALLSCVCSFKHEQHEGRESSFTFIHAISYGQEEETHEFTVETPINNHFNLSESVISIQKQLKEVKVQNASRNAIIDILYTALVKYVMQKNAQWSCRLL